MAKTKLTSANDTPPVAANAPAAATSDEPGKAGSRYETIAVEVRESVALVVLSRPDVHNAFNATLIAELTHVLRNLDRDASVRAVILLGEGKSFCAGADLKWMTEMARYAKPVTSVVP